jgi:hypothetical protein
MRIENMQEDKNFKITTVKEAVAYLNRQAWKISSKSLYRHMAEAKVERPPWSKDQLDVYAAKFLKPAELPSGPTPSNVKKSAQELIRARRQKIELEIETKEFDLQLKKKNYIEITEHVRLFCKKALILKDVAHNWIYENHRQIIRACNGDETLFYDVIRTYHDGFDSYWARCDIDGPIRLLSEDVNQAMKEGIRWKNDA